MHWKLWERARYPSASIRHRLPIACHYNRAEQPGALRTAPQRVQAREGLSNLDVSQNAAKTAYQAFTYVMPKPVKLHVGGSTSCVTGDEQLLRGSVHTARVGCRATEGRARPVGPSQGHTNLVIAGVAASGWSVRRVQGHRGGNTVLLLNPTRTRHPNPDPGPATGPGAGAPGCPSQTRPAPCPAAPTPHTGCAARSPASPPTPIV